MTKRTVAIAALGLMLALAPIGAAHAEPMMGKKAGRRAMAGDGQTSMHGLACPMMSPDVDVKVENLKDGAVIRITSSDAKEASRIQKRAEIMRLLHELHQEMAEE